MKKNKNGFTLIELLVVILIIAICISFLSLSGSFYQNKDRELHDAAVDFKILLEYAQEEAIVQLSEIGVRLQPQGYQFLRYEDKPNNAAWNTIADDVLGTYTVPSSTQLQVKIANNPNQNSGHPQILLSPNGEITPFTIEFSSSDKKMSYFVIGEAGGKITLKEKRNH